MPDLKLRTGADPEFSVLWNGQRVAAHQVIANLFKGDSRLRSSTLKTAGGELGVDGCAETGELRPLPHLNPIEVAKNIGMCLKEFADKGPGFDLTTLSLWAPIGGHIHLELPENSTDVKMNLWHRQLMSFYLPIMMSEEKASIKIRMSRYGQITDKRGPEGSRRTMEVRCPSAEWITTKRIAEAVLSYMAVVWNEVVHHPKNLPTELILKNEKQEMALQDMAVNEFDIATNSILREIGRAVRKFEMYEAFKDQIEYVLKPHAMLSDKRAVSYSINEGWGFSKNTRRLTKRLFLGVQKDGPSIDGETFDIFHNDDMRTGLYAEELRKKIASGTKLNHSYYIFGLKKGINGMLLAKKGIYYKTPDYATQSDIDAIRNTVQKMESKSSTHDKEKTTLDYAHGRVQREMQKCVLVGIPYDIREKSDLKPFLELIWQFEKGEMPELKLSPKEQTRGSSPVQALIPQGELQNVELVTDTSSQGSQLANDGVRQLLDEQRNQDLLAQREIRNEQFDLLKAYLETCKVIRIGSYQALDMGEGFANGERCGQGSYHLYVFADYQRGWENSNSQIDGELTISTPNGNLVVPRGMLGLYWASEQEISELGDRSMEHFQLRVRCLGETIAHTIPSTTLRRNALNTPVVPVPVVPESTTPVIEDVVSF